MAGRDASKQTEIGFAKCICGCYVLRIRQTRCSGGVNRHPNRDRSDHSKLADKRSQQARRGNRPAAKPARKRSGPGPAKPGVAGEGSSGQAPGASGKRSRGKLSANAATAAPVRELTVRNGPLPPGNAPLILEVGDEDGYRLIDSGRNAQGAGEKLELYGDLRVIRPEAQALWPRSLPDAEWNKADALFTGDTDEDGIGRWAFPHVPLGETWPMQLLGVDFHGRLTSFRHVGVFPEQIAHWRWMAEQINQANRPLKVLNLFGYTGVASLVAAKAGAEVTHVDASKKAIGWARENQALAGLENRPVRWICEDAMKFIAREERRGNRYDIILTDPPKFGRGPNGEVWQLFDHLPLMLDICRELLSPKPLGLVLTAYSIRASFYAIHELMRETMRGAGGVVESGELILRESTEAGAGRALSTSLYSRWLPQ
jgi:23S rRNA (cytosine1962-C5)-methyltransferase